MNTRNFQRAEILCMIPFLCFLFDRQKRFRGTLLFFAEFAFFMLIFNLAVLSASKNPIQMVDVLFSCTGINDNVINTHVIEITQEVL